MIKVISNFTEFSYIKILKPILFLFKPDFVHNLMLFTGRILGKLKIFGWIFRIIWRYDNEQTLAQTFNGVYFKNPLGLSAGFDKNSKLLNILYYVGFGFAEVGSITLKASSGNPKPHYHRLKKTKSILVYAGLSNEGIDIIGKRIKKDLINRKKWLPIDISVAKTNSSKTCTDQTGIDDYIGCLKKLKKMNIGEQITINISCPNAYGGEPFTTPERLEKLLKEVDKLNLIKPIYLKMPIDQEWSQFKKLVDVSIKHKIVGLKIGNLAKDRKKAQIKDFLADETPGNMSGKPTYELGNALIGQTYKYYGDKLIIVGVGGIFNAKEAYQKIKLGASLLEMITGMIFEGPQVIGKINKELTELIKKDGYSHISEAIGAYHKK